MALEKRGSSWRAKIFDGKTLVVQRTFHTKAEAKARGVGSPFVSVKTVSGYGRNRGCLNAIVGRRRCGPIPSVALGGIGF